MRLGGLAWLDGSGMGREADGAVVADDDGTEAQDGPNDQHAQMSGGAGAVEVGRAAEQVRTRSGREQLSNPVDRIQWTAPAVAQSVDRRVVVSPAQARSLLAAVRALSGRGSTWRRSSPACTTPRCARRRP